MAEVAYDPEVPKWNAKAFRGRWRAGMFIELHDYRGPRSKWKQRRFILVKKVSSTIWRVIELTRSNRFLIIKNKPPESTEITLEYITTPHIYFISAQLPADLGWDG